MLAPMSAVYPKPCRTDTTSGRGTAVAEDGLVFPGSTWMAGKEVRIAFDGA
jgi:hypothetical protein